MLILQRLKSIQENNEKLFDALDKLEQVIIAWVRHFKPLISVDREEKTEWSVNTTSYRVVELIRKHVVQALQDCLNSLLILILG